MKKTTVKMCGFQTSEDVKKAIPLSPDYMGFILVPGRTRTVSHTTLQNLLQHVPDKSKRIAVMQNPSFQDVAALMHAVQIDGIQLHGNESVLFCREIKNHFDLQLIKVFHIEEGKPVPLVKEYLPWIDVILLDYANKNKRGGQGVSFDWRQIVEVKNQLPSATLPVWVAGGLHRGNVGALIDQYAPDGIDLSSGIETNGKKDSMKMRQLIDEVSRVDEK
ncbi:phosphoribosylanthranilate isomerase [Hazenella sp. IB182357]|uniref:N-(5'-phosphoribosyl)anthranilate isomerase n=1 Tax=Polycladospora coralii TaxID=2771432 RepID=A0A926RTP6_9BACL|nr:phosphoribosylanthranilate isomerase [Polycladospora coralii]MBD1371612.1 phosphoribosylanthranilate isomerase [Polycladospora coralii]MBS7529079.1 phosphoribosylanthranilate isomerase [Polycladospora coralii]